jgi:hypothetical protein
MWGVNVAGTMVWGRHIVSVKVTFGMLRYNRQPRNYLSEILMWSMAKGFGRRQSMWITTYGHYVGVRKANLGHNWKIGILKRRVLVLGRWR